MGNTFNPEVNYLKPEATQCKIIQAGKKKENLQEDDVKPKKDTSNEK